MKENFPLTNIKVDREEESAIQTSDLLDQFKLGWACYFSLAQ